MRPHRRQPTRLPHPWDSPGKNTGVGCHFLLQCMKVKSEVAQSCPTLCDPMDCSPPGSSTHGIFRARVLEWVATTFIPKTILGHLQYISPCNQINFQLIIIKHWEVNWELRGEEKNTGYKSKITNVNEFNSNFCIFEHSDEEQNYNHISSEQVIIHSRK